MTLTWYRKWRPQSYADVVGQDHVVLSLQRALQKNLIGHAYLFCGPRGVGKTTMARLLAKSVNCLSPINDDRNLPSPCGNCQNCQAFDQGNILDVVEIDAASNRVK